MSSSLPVLQLSPIDSTFPTARLFVFHKDGPEGRVLIGRECDEEKTKGTMTNGWFRESGDYEMVDEEGAPIPGSAYNGGGDDGGGSVINEYHAEVWSEGGKIYIKDLSSAHGTYVNERRLSPPSQESAPTELNDGDRIDLGEDLPPSPKKRKISAKVKIDSWSGHEVVDDGKD